MTIIFKMPIKLFGVDQVKNDEKTKEIFEKEIEPFITPEQWAYWAGWMDSDGCFKFNTKNVCLYLTDRDPCEVFAKTFKGSLNYRLLNAKYYKNKNPKNLYMCNLSRPLSKYFALKVKDYLFVKNKKCKDFLKMCYGLDSEINANYDCSNEIFLSWLTAFIEGDGSLNLSSRKNYNKFEPNMNITSESLATLTFIQDRLNKLNIDTHLRLSKKAGEKIQVCEEVSYKRNNNIYALKFTVKAIKDIGRFMYPRMTLLRKKETLKNILLNNVLKKPEQVTYLKLSDNINQQKGKNDE